MYFLFRSTSTYVHIPSIAKPTSPPRKDLFRINELSKWHNLLLRFLVRVVLYHRTLSEHEPRRAVGVSISSSVISQLAPGECYSPADCHRSHKYLSEQQAVLPDSQRCLVLTTWSSEMGFPAAEGKQYC